MRVFLRRLQFWYVVIFVDRIDALRRRVKIENRLFNYYSKNTNPTPEECLQMAVDLGVPDYIKIRNNEHG